jgi:predicted dehydrogenase
MSTNRREFIKNTVAGSAGLMFSSLAFGTTMKPIVGANGKINVAVIGVRGIGQGHISSYKRQTEDVRIAALCDCDTDPLDEMLGRLAKDGIQPKRYIDLRKLYEDKEIDAVSIGMPNYWHALATVWACQAGKHVCVEKPVSHSIWEGRKMVEAARKYKRLVQADLDRHSNPSVAAAIEYLQKNLGKVHHIRVVSYKRRESIGKLTGPGTVPATCDYDLHSGPIPMMALPRKEIHYDWHWQFHTGNGELGNNGPHELDLVRWALKKTTAPTRAISFGGRFGYIDDGNVPNSQIVWYDYDGIPLIYDSRALGEKTGIDNMDGVTDFTATGKKIYHPFRGNANCAAYIFCENGYYTGDSIFDNDGKLVKKFDEPGKVGPQVNFIRALKSGKIEDLKTDIQNGAVSANISHIGNISYQTGHQVPFEELRKISEQYVGLTHVFEGFEEHLRLNGINPAKENFYLGPELNFDNLTERFIGAHSEVANLFLKRNYRESFVIPEKV